MPAATDIRDICNPGLRRPAKIAPPQNRELMKEPGYRRHLAHMAIDLADDLETLAETLRVRVTLTRDPMAYREEVIAALHDATRACEQLDAALS